MVSTAILVQVPMARSDICGFGEYPYHRVFLVLNERLAVMGQQVDMTEAQCECVTLGRCLTHSIPIWEI
jgi:hypothetical protein